MTTYRVLKDLSPTGLKHWDLLMQDKHGRVLSGDGVVLAGLNSYHLASWLNIGLIELIEHGEAKPTARS